MTSIASDLIERLEAWPAVDIHSDALSAAHVGALMAEAAEALSQLTREVDELREALEEMLAAHHGFGPKAEAVGTKHEVFLNARDALSRSSGGAQ